MKRLIYKSATGRVLAFMMAAVLAGSNVSYAALLTESDSIAAEYTEEDETGVSLETEEAQKLTELSTEGVEEGASDEGLAPELPETSFDETGESVAQDNDTDTEEETETLAEDNAVSIDGSGETPVSEKPVAESENASEAESDEMETETEEETEAEENNEIDTDLPQLKEGEDLIAPSNLRWSDDVPGTIIYEVDKDQKAFYTIQLVRDGVNRNRGTMDDPSRFTLEGDHYICTFDFSSSISNLGGATYTVKIKAGVDSNDTSVSSGAVAESPAFVYEEPAQKLPVPANVHWSETEPGVAVWEGVENAQGYWISLMRDGTVIGNAQRRRSTPGETYTNSFAKAIGNDTDSVYTFEVKSLCYDLKSYAASDWAVSEPLNQNTPSQSSLLSDAEDGVNNASTQAEAEQSIRDLWNEMNIDEMMIAIQTKEEVRDAVKNLEEAYKGKAGISVSTVVTDEAEIDTSETQVDILGAGLNSEAGSSVTFTIDKADAHDDHIIDTSLWVNVTRFDMDIDGVVTDSEGNLMFPVTVTMPVPSNVKDKLTMRILHYHHSDNGYDLITPRFNSDGTVSFTVTHFSEFVFAEENQGGEGTESCEDGHIWGDPVVNIEGSRGTAEFTCERCGHEYKMEFVIDGDKCAISSLISTDVSEIMIPDSISGYGVINILSNAFAFQEGITSVVIPEGVESIGFFAFSCCYGLTDITFPKSLKSIGEEAFANCSGLTEVTAQAGLETIGDSAFDDCINLEKITLPEGLKDIGKYAFSDCSSLTSIELPESLIGINNYVFNNCSGLTTVTMSSQVTTIGDGAFYGCRSLSDITLPPRVMSIGSGAFMYCSSLTDFTIPMNTTRLQRGVLADCTGLKSIVITRNVMNIEENAVGMYYSEVYQAYRPVDGFIIYGYEGSPAEEYAKTNGITFVALAPVTGVSLNVSSTTVPLGGTVTLIPTISPANAGNKRVSWQSSNTNIAAVDQNGVVTGIKTGIATITVKTDDYGKTARCTVQVLFTDVPASGVYYSDPVYWAAGKGITAGYSDGSFGVGRDCQRRELMIFLWRYAGQPTGYGDARKMFNDLSAYGPNSATNKAIAWAYKTGISKGYSDGGFHPEASIVRKDVMIMLYRLAGKPAVSGTLSFSDCKKYNKSSDTYKAILWGSKNGITNGYSDGEYAGQFGDLLNCLREQIVTFLKRYDNKKGNWKK